MVIALNKPSGLAVQGGSGCTERHVDGMLDALRFGYEERPRLSIASTRTRRACC